MNTILTKEYLEDEYLTKKQSVREIAKRLGYSYSYLQAKIKEFGITRRRQFHDLTGKPFNLLTPVRCVGVNEQQQAFWECNCKCGGQKIVRASSLVLGVVKSCGCVWRKKFGDISGAHFSNIRQHARLRNISFDIKVEDIWNLYVSQNKKCALSGVEISFDKKRGKTTASLDRIDSSKGYTPGNVQWVHKEVNRIKTDMPLGDFLKWVELIAAKHRIK